MFQAYIIISYFSLEYKSILKLETEYFNSHKELIKQFISSYGSLDYKDWGN